MLVCHCRGVFDREIRAVVREGAQTLDQVGTACGAGADCGGCQAAVEEIIEGECAGRHPVRLVGHSDLESRSLSRMPLPIVRIAS
jgi:bacterioferritin-associated ferredoxin